MKTIDEILNEWYPTIPDEEHNGLYARDKVKLIAQEFADQFRQPVVMCCASCFKEIPENHFERRAHHDNEHCPNCGNDFMGSKWFSQPLPKDKIDKIRAAILA